MVSRTPRVASLQLLEGAARFGMRFGLERIHALLAALGRPAEALKVLHVAGTNGKGSTCAFASSLLQAAGLKVGLYTSPHLSRVNERIRIGGRAIGDAHLAEGVERLREACPAAFAPSDPATYFELLTAIALWHFAKEATDAVVLETGLGGRLDATNAVRPQVTAITRVDLDHTALLGTTLRAIALEKAGILKPGAPLLLARQHPEAEQAILERAAAAGIAVRLAGRDFELVREGTELRFRSDGAEYGGLALSLAGSHQLRNAEVALEAARLLLPELGLDVVREGLRRTRWPGRLERFEGSPPLLLDGAHNPSGAKALVEAMRELYPNTPLTLVFGMLADKDVDAVARTLVPFVGRVFAVTPKSERSLPAAELAAMLHGLGAEARAATLPEALDAARSAAPSEGGVVHEAGSL